MKQVSFNLIKVMGSNPALSSHELATYLGPTIVEELVFAVVRKGYRFTMKN